MRIKVTGWNNEKGGLVPLQAEFTATRLDKKEIIEKGKELLVRQIRDELGDIWLHDVKFWRIGGVTWQIDDELSKFASQTD